MAPQILTSIYPPLPKASYTNIFDYVSSGLESSLADKVQFVRQDGKEFTGWAALANLAAASVAFRGRRSPGPLLK
ncbi:hypothetical protein [Sporisorium scitamineum]|uniref:Uncharacterized protein n=1 Tax=Sporisorium scitamineum TaxID=49012 RepID=A0A0F7RYI4_9BASI|nr:hypothetical protein [Sporisorium scitamineum]